MNNMPLVRGLGSEDADLIREVNFSNQYYKMLNRYGREVCISIDLVNDKLKRGFVHTDGKIYSDDMSKQHRAPAPISPIEAVAKMAEKMAESTEAMKEMVADKMELPKNFLQLKKLAAEKGMTITQATKKDEVLAFLNQ